MAVVDKLKVELLEEEKDKVTKRHTVDKDAHNLYLRGRYFWNRRHQGDMIKAVNFYQKAIDKDPGYALPYVGIADVFNIFGQWAFIHPKEAYTKTKAMLKKALEIDSSLSELYTSLGFVTGSYEWDLAAAGGYFRRSLELNPQNVYAHGWYAEMLSIVKRDEEALVEMKKAVELDPLFSLVHALYGVILAGLGQMEEGREQILKAIAMDPEQPMPYLWLGMIYCAKPPLPEKAIEYLKKAASFGITFAYGWLGSAYAMSGQRDEALKILAKLEKIEKERHISPLKKLGIYLKPGLRHFRFLKKKYVSPMLKAVVYLGLNMQEEALEYFEKSSQARDFFLPEAFALMDFFDFPWIEEFTSQPRFKALKEKVKVG